MTESALLTLPQAAERLGVSRRTVEREIAAGNIPSIRIRGARKIASRDLEDYIARSRHYTEPPCRYLKTALLIL